MTMRPWNALAVLAPAPLLLACVAAPAAPAVAPPQLLKVGSTPSDGSTVHGPLDELRLRFTAPARLTELTVSGGDGMTIPMMITAVGEVRDYAIPLPSLGAGSYVARWKATAAGAGHEGSIRFTVR